MKLEITGQELKRFINASYTNLKNNVKIINDLNVFPIPDGDTGDNMCLTLKGGVDAIKPESETAQEVASDCAEGMLMNARGNSGVILSQLFYGFSNGLDNAKTINLKCLQKAFASAVDCAYHAVDKPTEGTILTVAREVCEKVAGLSGEEENVIDLIVEWANESVLKTPELLPVLKQAGVVDSGGAGLFYIFEGISKLKKGTLDFVLDENMQIKDVKEEDLDYSSFNENSKLEFGYCSEVLLQLLTSKTDIKKFNIERIREFLSSIGDSIVLVQTGSVIKIHVHTFTPSKLLEYCQQFGEFLKIKIENMTIQHTEATIQNRFEPIKVQKIEKQPFGVVTVASGEGLINTFKELGADVVINGGQTNNPSAEDFINAFKEVNAETIFVLPNNSNIILTAKQAQKIFKDSKIYIIETKSIGEGYSALAMLDYSSNDAKEIERTLTQEAKNAVCGSVSVATRNAKFNDFNIKTGDFLGITGKNIVNVVDNKVDALMGLVKTITDESKSFCVVIYGKNFKQDERAAVKIEMQEKYPVLEFYEIDGGQDIFDAFVILS